MLRPDPNPNAETLRIGGGAGSGQNVATCQSSAGRVETLEWILRRYCRMLTWVKNLLRSNKNVELDPPNDLDPLLWFRDLEQHAFGEYSFAAVQGNTAVEDFSQVETGHQATFIGVYDGHGGRQAAHFTCDHLFNHVIDGIAEHGISQNTLRDAIAATEEGFLALVTETAGVQPLIQSVGTCCVAGIISQGTLYVANMGDSRAVIGRLRNPNEIVAEQITEDHNVSVKRVRRELKRAHPDDPNIVIKRNDAWRVKGIIQITKSIGDAYLKRPEFALGEDFPRFHLPQPLVTAVIGDKPALYSRVLTAADRFVVFASDGLFEHLTNAEVVKLVHRYPRSGIARRLIKSAVKEGGRKRRMRYQQVKRIGGGLRRPIHDDITVVVVFFDQLQANAQVAELSMRGFSQATTPSRFNTL
ncbi:putative protein phosphatase 2C 43 [Bidens hawaiensis]|uniref:putative protein phosphatase 2C 43 n=1 Tax=Bidens hawaiensis TaxID=980011 RepID=UPI00404B61D7